MWTSDRRLGNRLGDGAADLGSVTLGGDPAGVYTGGERRWLPVYSPGGYRWRPTAGDQVLVIKAGEGREAPCITGCRQGEGELAPGEVRIGCNSGEIRIHQDDVKLMGSVTVNGVTLEELMEQIVVRKLSNVLQNALTGGED